jgi:hypothetical protein
VTQILTFISPVYTAQVADRLVTTAERGPFSTRYRDFDQLANKSLIYVARDALVCIGYAGLAFLEQRPTDYWLAEILRGSPIPRHGDKPAAFGSGTRNRMDLGLAILKVQRELERVVRSLPADQIRFPTEVIFAGWQWNGGHLRPVAIELQKPAGQVAVTLSRVTPRNWPKDKLFAICDTGGWMQGRSEYKEFLFERLRKIRIFEQPNAVIAALADTVRHISERERGVIGQNLMSCLLPPPGREAVEVRLLPRDRHLLALHRSGGPIEHVEAAYTPWILGPSQFCAPSVIVGSWETSIGGIRITVSAPESTSGLLAAFSSHQRPDPA